MTTSYHASPLNAEEEEDIMQVSKPCPCVHEFLQGKVQFSATFLHWQEIKDKRQPSVTFALRPKKIFETRKK